MNRYLLLLALGLFATSLDSAPLRYVAKKGDTWELLAAEYYGDRRHARFLRAANNQTEKDALRPRKRIRIPMRKEVITKAGDSLATLAQEHLGDETRAPFLAYFNKLEEKTSLPAGLRIIIPFHIKIRIPPKTSFKTLARQYYWESAREELIVRYNGPDSAKLPPGKSILLPFTFRTGKIDTRAIKKADREREQVRIRMAERAEIFLKQSQAAWLTGDYKLIRELLTPIDTSYLDEKQAIAVDTLLARTHVAFQDDESARQAFKRVLSRAPDFQLDPAEFSPRVRALFSNLQRPPD